MRDAVPALAEYKAANPDGFQYAWFCDAYRDWRGRSDLVMRQTHRAGEKLFVDFSGMTVPLVDRQTGEIRQAQIFVAVLGASNYTYAEALASQGLADRIGAHVRAFGFLGGVPEVLVSDNLASGVTKPCRYEPDINSTYADMAAHYGVAVVPARVRKPKDKAKVDACVLLVERWVLARLRNQVFCSLAELNRSVGELVAALNQRPFKNLPGCRRSAFESLDCPALQPLPATPYEFAQWKQVKVRRREGRYLLRSNLAADDPALLWKHYIQLTEVGQAFKELKGDLLLRPVHHQTDARIEAHIFVAFVAYCLQVTLKHRLRALAPGLTPRAVLEKMAALQMVDVHLPTTDGRCLVLSRHTQPEKDQQLLLAQLKLVLPPQPPPKITSNAPSTH